MKVPSVDIIRFIKDDLTKEVSRLHKKKVHPKLLSILVGDNPEMLAAAKTKQKIAKELGIEFELLHLETEPPFLQFANILKDKSADPTVTGIVIEQPLPITLQSDTLYNFIPVEKEIEGHKKKTPYFPPVGLTVLMLLKYIFQHTQLTAKLYPVLATDAPFFKQTLKQKRIVLIGSAVAIGQPVAKVLSTFRINFINVNSQTFEPEQYYKDADVIITSAGKNVLSEEYIKQGVVLINVNKDGIGDYEESKVKNKAAFYTPIAKGTTIFDTLFIFKNLIDATKLQQ